MVFHRDHVPVPQELQVAVEVALRASWIQIFRYFCFFSICPSRLGTTINYPDRYNCSPQ
ncbi:bifunctional orotidine 5'-phosphate decarboxylase/orotate phosphoribosyltransferase protein [Lyngbya sp. PCC 8106]|nr:bifunctional orotidine 5'-phosphate decarboxylase/orotate phosphoribosyltransferase protein [Lyngbya sp. PCC 8106]